MSREIRYIHILNRLPDVLSSICVEPICILPEGKGFPARSPSFFFLSDCRIAVSGSAGWRLVIQLTRGTAGEGNRATCARRPL